MISLEVNKIRKTEKQKNCQFSLLIYVIFHYSFQCMLINVIFEVVITDQTRPEYLERTNLQRSRLLVRKEAKGGGSRTKGRTECEG